jgi:hypothetical protein
VTLDRDVFDHIRRTARGVSRRDRANQLLRRAIQLERREQLAVEAERFFRRASKVERRETRAWLRAGRDSWDCEVGVSGVNSPDQSAADDLVEAVEHIASGQRRD